MYKIGIAMKLRPGAYPGYKKHHDELWPDIAKSMSDNDVSMIIYRHGDTLFLHATAPTEADWLKSREVPILEDWQALMAEFLVDDGMGAVQAEELEISFEFGDYKDG